MVVNPFRFEGRIARWPFIGAALVLVLVQQAAHHILVGDYWFSPTAFANPWFAQFHQIWMVEFGKGALEPIAYAVPIGVILLASWALAAIAFRRAATVAENPMLAIFAFIPFIQLIAIAILALRNDQEQSDDPQRLDLSHRRRAAVTGALAGTTLSLMLVLVFTLALSSYGSALFIGVPLAFGFVTGVIANRSGDIGGLGTTGTTFGALVVLALALIGFALEGALCLIMAFPLAFVLAWLGAITGRVVVLRWGKRRSTLMSVSTLPLLLAISPLVPPQLHFENVQSIEVAASPDQVWNAIIDMGAVTEPPAAPFGWGLAYPVSGTISGEGIGAIREGRFSTGVAYERVTRWEPDRALEFDVLSDPPALRELSPFGKVAAPHVSGYFRTRDARFAITALANGRTRLTLRTGHDLAVGPSDYWRIFAEWAVNTNKRRVLEHFRTRAENSAAKP